MNFKAGDICIIHSLHPNADYAFMNGKEVEIIGSSGRCGQGAYNTCGCGGPEWIIDSDALPALAEGRCYVCCSKNLRLRRDPGLDKVVAMLDAESRLHTLELIP